MAWQEIVLIVLSQYLRSEVVVFNPTFGKIRKYFAYLDKFHKWIQKGKLK